MGGYGQEGGKPPLEIIDLINTKLKSEVVLYENGSRSEFTGGVLQNQPLICGDYENPKKWVWVYSKNVSVIGMPNHCFEMMIPR